MYNNEINAYFKANADSMLEDISRLVAIDSSRSGALDGKPFGEGPAEALRSALEIGKRMGFTVRNVDNYAGVIECADAEPELGILAHLDVVEAGSGWTYKPFEMTREGGMIYGRGVTDDKGPAVAALYALAAVREIDPERAKKTRLILGCAEETGSECMAYYRTREPFPKHVFSPDSEFPVINIEKGRYAPVFEARWAKNDGLPRVVSLEGGKTTNVIPSKARAVIEGLSSEEIEAVCRESRRDMNISFELVQVGSYVRIDAAGKSAHASTPGEGVNALTALISLVSKLPIVKSKGFTRLKSVAKLFSHGDNAGRALGIDMADNLSGALTLAFTVFKMDETGLRAQFDSRVPLCGNDENVRREAEQALASEQLIVTSDFEMLPPHHTPGDSEFVKTLLSVYERWTGNKGSCIALGGITYVHDIEGGVAFGCAMPGKRDGNIHGPDEYAQVGDLILSAKIFTDAILQITDDK